MPGSSNTVNPSPAGSTGRLKVSETRTTGSATTSPSDGCDDSRPVWAATGAGVATVSTALTTSASMTATAGRRAGEVIGRQPARAVS
jgi:hypothetical protein